MSGPAVALDLGPSLDAPMWWSAVAIAALVLARLARARIPRASGAYVMPGAVLAGALAARALAGEHAGAAATALVAVLLVGPTLVGHRVRRHLLAADYAAAARWARWAERLPGWRGAPDLYRALAAAERGSVDEAVTLLRAIEREAGPLAVRAELERLRIEQRWAELVARAPLASPGATDLLAWTGALRALGELGRTRELAERFAALAPILSRAELAALRHQCELLLFAFGGEERGLERLLAGPLAGMHADHRVFWAATAAFAAGRTDVARSRLAPLAEVVPAPRGALGDAVARRIAAPPPLASTALGAEGAAIVARAVAALEDELHHGERPRPRLRSVTAALVAVNVAAFGVESAAGGATDVETLFRLGAMAPAAVWSGEWWRPFSATFLHFGLAHLAFNLVGLLLFGPFVESRLGRVRYAIVYLLSGAGSMWGLAVLGWLGWVPSVAIVVGASGSVMGVIGAQAAWLRRSWVSDRSPAARRRARDLIAVIAIQSFIDLSVSSLTLAAHLLGFVLGLALASRSERGVDGVGSAW